MAEPGITNVSRDWVSDGSQTMTLRVVLPPQAVLNEAGARRRERLGGTPDLAFDGMLGWLEETLKRVG